jgi:signal peptidase II
VAAGAAERSWRLALATTGVVLALDQVTKQLATASVERGDKVNVFFGLDLANSRNTGVAFGALESGGAVVGVLIGVTLALLLGYFALRPTMPWLWLPTGLLVGGALGNLADRAREGAVIDFVDPSFWPAFNLADAAIVIGVLSLLYVVESSR